MSRIFITLLLLSVLVIRAAAAQEEGVLTIGAPDASAFPLVRFQMDAYDEQDRFISTLKAEAVQVLENGQARKPDSVKKIDTGLQIIVALNLDPSMGKTQNDTTEYQRVQTALSAWAEAQPEQQSIDDFSLSTPTGLFLIRQREPRQFARALTDYQPDLARAQSSLNSLAEALDLATDPAGRPGIKRSILFVTPPLPAAQSDNLPELAGRAREIGVRVNVWLVGASSTAPNPLQRLAENTGGQFFNIIPGGALPEVESVFRSFRQSYEITYQSGVQKSGDHSVSAAVEDSNYSLSSNEQRFSIEVLPPNPIFLSPPASIERTWTTEKNSTANGEAGSVLTPEAVDLQIVLEFPDRHAREITASRLFVDDQMVDENTSEPFDWFRWPMGGQDITGRRMLRVEVVDSLGLTGSSISVPVDVVVAVPAQTRLAENISTRGIITIAAIAISGAALALVLTVTGTQRLRRKNQAADKNRMKDPVTQPVKIRQEPVSKPRKNGTTSSKPAADSKPSAARASAAWPAAWPRAQSQSSAPARLLALDESEQPLTGGTVPLNRQEITFGSDPRRATQVVDSPTIDGLHARLYRSADSGDYFLADNGSVAGTWVNYIPINGEGVRLEHGDLIHLGRSMFRFELTDPARAQPASVKVVRLDM